MLSLSQKEERRYGMFEKRFQSVSENLKLVFFSLYSGVCCESRNEFNYSKSSVPENLKERTFLLSICFRSKELKKDFYLAPYTCAEIGFLYQDEGDLDRAKEYLERARYSV